MEYRAKAYARAMLSGSSCTSSSSRMWWVASVDSSISYIVREKPPLPPRFGCSTSRSRSPSAPLAAAKPAASRTFLVPWSATMTLLISPATTGSSASALRAPTQSSGRLNVQMPMDSRVSWAGSWAADQAARWTVKELSSAVTSNQYQPPSSNGVRSRSNSSVRRSPGVVTPVTWMTLPSALDRYTSIRPGPDTSRPRTTVRSTVQRRQ